MGEQRLRVLRQSLKRCCTRSSWLAGTDIVLIGCPPSTVEWTADDTNSISKIHAALPKGHDQLRNRTVGSKMTESEYEKLVAVAERDGLTLGEWCREVLLAQASTTEGTRPIATEQTLLAEVMALRTILLNALFKLAQGAVLTTEELDRLIEQADGERLERAQERVAEVPTGGRS